MSDIAVFSATLSLLTEQSKL